MLVRARHSESAYQRETVPFLGLNRSDDTREGEFSEQKNMSGRRYPFLAPRLPMQTERFDPMPSALFGWDGARIMVQDGKLLHNEEILCNVTDGEKQFAVVNTKLVVWPDKLAVDLTNKSVTTLDIKGVNKNIAVLTNNSVQFSFSASYADSTLRYGSYDGNRPYIYTYGSVSWDNENGWTKEDGRWTLPHESGRTYIPNVLFSQSTQKYSVGNPADLFSTSTPDIAPSDEPTNTLGFYVTLGKSTYSMGADFYSCVTQTSVYWAQDADQTFGKVFSVGDVVSISGGYAGVTDVHSVKILAIDEDANKITFDTDTIRIGAAAYKSDSSQQIRLFYWTDVSDGTTVRVSTKSVVERVQMEPGYVAVIDFDFIRVYNEGWSFVKSYPAEKVDTSSGVQDRVKAYPISKTDQPICVERKLPELDFICERENRLCGVSNKDNTIYISALGDPSNFYDYTGDQGSFSVAVGSDGDFTGICDYGNALLCWKERTLHKVLGDYPSNYQTATYRFSGVRAGAHKSLVNVNETLFFLGVDGVYAYTGNKPSLISRALGASVLKDGVGGTDGRAYYLCVRNGVEHELLNYDTHTGMWSRSDEIAVTDFCRVDDELKFLSGDTVYTIGAGDESVEWEAVFVPMYETLEGGKQYNRLIFRAEVPKGGWLAADVRFDDGRWMQVGIVKGKNGPVHMPVPLRRCDKFQIRLRGKGDCAVLDMVREFRLRGDG
jgi:hypothetical protein